MLGFGGFVRSNVGALIVRIGFGGNRILYL